MHRSMQRARLSIWQMGYSLIAVLMPFLLAIPVIRHQAHHRAEDRLRIVNNLVISHAENIVEHAMQVAREIAPPLVGLPCTEAAPLLQHIGALRPYLRTISLIDQDVLYCSSMSNLDHITLHELIPNITHLPPGLTLSIVPNTPLVKTRPALLLLFGFEEGRGVLASVDGQYLNDIINAASQEGHHTVQLRIGTGSVLSTYSVRHAMNPLTVATQAVEDNNMKAWAQSLGDNNIRVATQSLADNNLKVATQSLADNNLEVATQSLADSNLKVATQSLADNNINAAMQPAEDRNIKIAFHQVDDAHMKAAMQQIEDSGMTVVQRSALYPIEAMASLHPKRLVGYRHTLWLQYFPFLAVASGLLAYLIHRLNTRRMAMATEIQRGIRCGEFCVQYQPIVDLTTGACVGAEALLRWQHPSYGLVQPASIFPLMEESALAMRLTRHLLHLIEQDLGHVALPKDFWLGINLHVEHLCHPDLVGEVERFLHNVKKASPKVMLELTERKDFPDTQTVVNNMRALRAIGVAFAIDDFGSGHSSLAFLEKTTVDFFKIDRGFISIIDTDAVNAPVLELIISLGARLGINLIGEGIETDAQANYLRAKGVKFAQGGLFSPPLTAASLLTRL